MRNFNISHQINCGLLCPRCSTATLQHFFREKIDIDVDSGYNILRILRLLRVIMQISVIVHTHAHLLTR